MVTGLGASGFAVTTSGSAEAAATRVSAEHYDLVLADINLPGRSGLDFCAQMAVAHPSLCIVVMTAYSSIKTAVAALRAGAHDYLMKPLDLDAVALRLRRIVESNRTANELDRLRVVVAEHNGFEELVGTSPAMQRVYELIAKAARTDVSVLVSGESGTGKELVARALHRRSARHEGPMVAVNCSAVPDALLESELFGHTKGAFTDAHASRPGLFAQADGGTLFLDELGEIAPAMQPKLLRALESRRIRPVGGQREVSVDIRLVAATNRDLETEVEDGRFREDLFFRVNVLRLHLPPLRARGSDVLMLAQRFVDTIAARFDKRIESISPDAKHCLMAYSWPGNVRELRNCIERAVALADGRTIRTEDLSERVRAGGSEQVFSAGHDPTELASLAEVEQRYTRHVLACVGGNKSQAAQILGVDRKTLHRRLASWEKRARAPSDG
ncbi:MAG: sigma-54-dependent Fis family transcriptional regulator [Myxococcales bacterium FL481]|nr:MAG: sigma-54-dependent Fis family transcriptional regulator [Myxococcales bacterium FL481]